MFTFANTRQISNGWKCMKIPMTSILESAGKSQQLTGLLKCLKDFNPLLDLIIYLPKIHKQTDFLGFGCILYDCVLGLHYLAYWFPSFLNINFSYIFSCLFWELMNTSFWLCDAKLNFSTAELVYRIAFSIGLTPSFSSAWRTTVNSFSSELSSLCLFSSYGIEFNPFFLTTDSHAPLSESSLLIGRNVNTV